MHGVCGGTLGGDFEFGEFLLGGVAGGVGGYGGGGVANGDVVVMGFGAGGVEGFDEFIWVDLGVSTLIKLLMVR